MMPGMAPPGPPGAYMPGPYMQPMPYPPGMPPPNGSPPGYQLLYIRTNVRHSHVFSSHGSNAS